MMCKQYTCICLYINESGATVHVIYIFLVTIATGLVLIRLRFMYVANIIKCEIIIHTRHSHCPKKTCFPQQPRQVPLFIYSIAVLSEGRIMFARQILLDHKNINSYIISQSNTNAAHICASHCVRTAGCESFFYNAASQECQLHDILFFKTAGEAKDENRYYYVLKGTI